MGPATGPGSATAGEREPLPAFCEQCGSAEAVIPGRSIAGPPWGGVLAVCPGCDLLSCEECWPGTSNRCAECTAADATRAPVTEAPALPGLPGLPDRVALRPALAATVVVLVGVAVLALAVLPRGAPSGAVGAVTAAPTGSRGAALGAGGATATPRSDLPGGTPAASASAGSGGPPSSTPGESPAPSRASATPGPVEAPVALDLTAAVARPWIDPFGQVRVQVLAAVTNDGSAAAYLPPARTTYRVLSPAGTTVAAGRFAHVFPARVEPGETAWFIDSISATFAEVAEVGSVDVSVGVEPADDGESGTGGVPGRGEPALDAELRVTADWTTDAAGGLVASGEVRNEGREALDRVAVGVVVLSPDGEPLAGAYDVEDVRDLAPGATARFSTSYPGSAPFDPRSAGEVEAFAVPLPE